MNLLSRIFSFPRCLWWQPKVFLLFSPHSLGTHHTCLQMPLIPRILCKLLALCLDDLQPRLPREILHILHRHQDRLHTIPPNSCCFHNSSVQLFWHTWISRQLFLDLVNPHQRCTRQNQLILGSLMDPLISCLGQEFIPLVPYPLLLYLKRIPCLNRTRPLAAPR